jgi:hypothetical protein
MLGPGLVQHPDDDPDDPEAIFCSQPSLGFRIVFGGVKARVFAVGDSVRDQKIKVTGLEVYPRDAKFAAYCNNRVLQLIGRKP